LPKVLAVSPLTLTLPSRGEGKIKEKTFGNEYLLVLKRFFAIVTLSVAKGLDSSVATLSQIRMTAMRNYF
jgi:hypothetical protein